ncbi:putative oxidoreductase [Humitalea rosea]|uniref:Putative oxidoreductase n=1 Tax=Humitalea rosea TaxID=990373 RepID=A0A2W7K016_9PROT|nr:malate/lactate/ureidoglycolate dehydrogenase [Humitalea rosea]PZW41020.1 putative oxidoreductase [Humitalea rosea]
MASYVTVPIPVATLQSVIESIFQATGCDAKEAHRVAEHLIGANLAGHDSHGVGRVPRYVEWLQQGFVLAGQSVETITDGGAFVLLDGKFGLGQSVARQAAAIGIERALANGSCIVGLRSAGHVGRIGEYAEQAIEQGILSIHFVNVGGSVLVAPFGGVERRFSTAPCCIGVPLDGEPVVLDFATSRVAEGKVLVASNGGKPLPGDALIEADGTLSGDPHTLYGDYEQIGPRNAAGGTGAIRAFGDHKGSGLAMICELLGGVLTGSGACGPITERGRICNGMLSIYLSPKHFGDEAAFRAAGRAYVDWVRSAQPADPALPVLAPGDPERALRAERTANGVPLSPDTWEGIRRCAQSLGVAVP